MALLGERDCIRRIRRRCGTHPLVERGIGDDCAVFGLGGAERGLVSADTLVAGIHFDLSWHPPRLLGRKAAAVNISDIAAMGGEPLFALLSLTLAPGLKAEVVDEVAAGFVDELRSQGMALIGGDTVAGNEFVIGVTVMGRVRGRVIGRDGAGAGDLIYVSRPLGAAAAGLRLCRRHGRPARTRWPALVRAHLLPTPEVALGALLAEHGLATAMIDLSDGLATDLAHVAVESGLAARLQEEKIPVHQEIGRALPDAVPLDLALTGGEDYALAFTVPGERAAAAEEMARSVLGRPLYQIGVMEPGRGVFLEGRGYRREITFQGYEHRPPAGGLPGRR